MTKVFQEHFVRWNHLTRRTPLRSAAVTVTAAVSVDDPDDGFDVVADGGGGFVGGVGNDGPTLLQSAQQTNLP